jgi:hypothetical protein
MGLLRQTDQTTQSTPIRRWEVSLMQTAGEFVRILGSILQLRGFRSLFSYFAVPSNSQSLGLRSRTITLSFPHDSEVNLRN